MAPPLNSRVNSVKNAIERGWQVRLCFDPVLMVDNWFDIYSKFFQELFKDVNGSDIRDVTLGVFRMNKDYFNKIRKRDIRSDIYFSDYSIEEGVVVVDSETRQFAMNELQNLLSKFISKDKILVWK